MRKRHHTRVQFDATEIRYANAPEPAEGVDPRLNEIVFAPLDYALVARR